MSRDNYWFKHEYDASEARKLVMLRRKGGYLAIGHYWTVYPLIHKARNCFPFANDNDRELLCDKLQVARDVLDTFINLCSECENLLEIRDGFLFSEKVERQLEEQAETSKKRAKAGSKGGKQKASNAKAKAKQSVANNSTSTVTDIQVDKEKNKKGALSSADFIFPEKLNNENCKSLIDNFIKHRAEKKSPVTKTQIEGVLKKYADKPVDFITNLEHSIVSGYQGIFAPKENGAPKGASVDPRANVILNSLGKV